MKINFDLLHKGAHQLAVTGHEVLVCTTRDSIESRPLPEALLDAMRPTSVTVEEARAELGVPATP